MSIKSRLKEFHDEYLKYAEQHCKTYRIPVSFVAALSTLEAGRDKNDKIVPTAKRFEPHVYAALIAVRDGKRANYGKIRRQDLADASDAAVRNLASSHGVLQVMGWHCLASFSGEATVADLDNVETHFKYACRLMRQEAGRDIDKLEFADAFRVWNTGREKGKTYHPSYVPNGLKAMEMWSEMYGADEASSVFTFLDAQTGAAADVDELVEEPAVVWPEGTHITHVDGVPTAVTLQPPPGTSTPTTTEVPPAAATVTVEAEPWWNKAKAIPAKVYAGITALTTAGLGTVSDWLGFFKDRPGLLYFILSVIALVGLVLMLIRTKKEILLQRQKFELELAQIKSAADPALTTVKVEMKK